MPIPDWRGFGNNAFSKRRREHPPSISSIEKREHAFKKMFHKETDTKERLVVKRNIFPTGEHPLDALFPNEIEHKDLPEKFKVVHEKIPIKGLRKNIQSSIKEFGQDKTKPLRLKRKELRKENKKSLGERENLELLERRELRKPHENDIIAVEQDLKENPPLLW